MRTIVFLLAASAAIGVVQAGKDAAAEENAELRFGYPDTARTTEEILDTGIMVQNKDGTLRPYDPEHATIASGDHKLFLVWERNP